MYLYQFLEHSFELWHQLVHWEIRQIYNKHPRHEMYNGGENSRDACPQEASSKKEVAIVDHTSCVSPIDVILQIPISNPEKRPKGHPLQEVPQLPLFSHYYQSPYKSRMGRASPNKKRSGNELTAPKYT